MSIRTGGSRSLPKSPTSSTVCRLLAPNAGWRVAQRGVCVAPDCVVIRNADTSGVSTAMRREKVTGMPSIPATGAPQRTLAPSGSASSSPKKTSRICALGGAGAGLAGSSAPPPQAHKTETAAAAANNFERVKTNPSAWMWRGMGYRKTCAMPRRVQPLEVVHKVGVTTMNDELRQCCRIRQGGLPRS